MKKRKEKLEANPYAPIFIRQIADSMIVMAAALLIIGVDLKDYFKPQPQKTIQEEIIESLEYRIIELEKHSHKQN